MNASKAVESLDGGGILYRLHLFSNNPAAVLDRIPDATPGIYAWFRHFTFSNEPSRLYEQILSETQFQKFASRSGVISPYFHVTVASQSRFSENKKEALKEFVQVPSNNEALISALNNSIFFQSPLYIGKAENLRQRIFNHMQPDSILSTRFRDYGIDILSSNLLIIPAPVAQSCFEKSQSSDIESMQNREAYCMENEVLLEEIFSRLFHPQLTLRIG
jgi:hypothetical protein